MVYGSFYKTGPIPCENCPFYNYLLPYNFPYVETDVTPNPKYYWYFPYHKDPTFYVSIHIRHLFQNPFPKKNFILKQNKIYYLKNNGIKITYLL